MSGNVIKEAVTGAVEYLTANPSEARYRDGSAQAVLRSGLVVDVSGPGGEAVTTDMVTSVGGTGSAPSPGWLLRAAAASCVATLVALRAATLDVAVESLEVTVDSESDDRGILGIDPAVPAGPLSLRVAVLVHAPGADADQLRGIVAWGVDHCPVIDAVRRAVPTEIRVEV
jgi:uncharacterized OsmC-like protein